jgi:transaldolase
MIDTDLKALFAETSNAEFAAQTVALKRITTVRMGPKRVAQVLCAAVVGAAIATAPVATADPGGSQETCAPTATASTVCQSPGDVEIKDAPPSITFYPYGSPPPTAG